MTGTVVAGRYVLGERLSRGATAEVWRAQDLQQDRPVALKLLRAGADQDARARFRSETTHASALRHPGVVAVLDAGESDDGRTAWIAMELVDGEPLSDLLAREGRLPVGRALDLVAQAGDALQAAHELGIVHRDVKPANLLVAPDGRVTVTDFGLARLAEGDHTAGFVIGTAAYLSPEQAAGRPVSPASDVYALGVVAFECLSGRLPFPGPTPAEACRQHLSDAPPPLPDDVPRPVRALVGRCLSKDPADRPADAGAVAREARALRRVQRPTLRRALVLALPLLLAVLLAGGARATLTGSGPTVPEVPPGTGLVEAQQRLLDAGFRPRWRPEVDPEVPEGRVVRTDPPAGARARRGSRVVVVTSGEPLIGRPYPDVRAALTRRGVVVRPVADGRDAPAGTVTGLEPDGPLAPGEEVLVHVVPGSQGRPSEGGR